jgi:hypothetical protein
MNRSLARITKSDLQRLGRLALADQRAFFARKRETGRLYARRLFAIALCQGAALHFLDRENGVKDFDVWCFYTANPERPFPPRRRSKMDFGNPKFGVTSDSPDFVGRRVDVMGRSVPGAKPSNPIESLRSYLSSGSTMSARHLAAKAVVLIEPAFLRGTIVWPIRSARESRKQ